MGVFFVSGVEWGSLSDDNEKDDCGGKEVNRSTIVALAVVDLWCHVTMGTELGLKETFAISSFSWSGEAKVCDFDVEGPVEHDVLWLEVSMDDPLIMSILKGHDNLLEVEPGSRLTESTTQGNEVEELSALRKFQHNELDLLLSLLWMDLSPLSNLDNFHNVWVIKHEECFNFSLNEGVELGARLEDLDGIASVFVILGKLDLA